MGSHDIRAPTSEAESRRFTRAILADVQALDRMWHEQRFETGQRRIGAEQELFLVGAGCRPAPVADRVLARLGDTFTTELALYNLEANLPPLQLDDSFLRHLEQSLGGAVAAARAAARDVGADIVMVGILPTLEAADLTLRNITPALRYTGLNDALVRSRGADFHVTIRGIDELETTNPSVMLESANTSFQLHLQVDPVDFVRLYNLIQTLTAPLLAPAVNSPVLLGRRLWHETRIALFERSVDGRTPSERTRGLRTRVGFGADWVTDGAVELFREDIARHRVLLMRELESDPMRALDRGELPELKALALFNGTVWRWNRPCFGVQDGVAHVRIENRVLPSGPTVLDAVSNAALFYGLVLGLDPILGDVRDRISFDAVHSNFLAVAQHGLTAALEWVDGRQVVARDLVEELLSVADDGLASVGVPSSERQRLLAPVAGRIATGQTGSRWMLDSLQELGSLPAPARLRRLVEAMRERQDADVPVHEWEVLHKVHTVEARCVRDVMTTDLYTVRPADVIDLASFLMEWEAIRHVPVEDDAGQVVGLVDQQALLRAAGSAEPIAVRDVMDPTPRCVSPDLSLHEAGLAVLTSPHGVLLVVVEGQLVGIVTERDLLCALR